MSWQVRAELHGWKVEQVCECEDPELVIVGGDGFYIPPLMCVRCRKREPK